MKKWLAILLAVLLVLQPFAVAQQAYAVENTNEEQGPEEVEGVAESETPLTNPAEPAEEASEGVEDSASTPTPVPNEGESAESFEQEETVEVTELSPDAPEVNEASTDEEETDSMMMAATDATGSEIAENLLTNYTINTTTKDNRPVDTVTTESIVEINYTWAIPNGHSYTEGSTFRFQIPEELKIYDLVVDQPLRFNSDSMGTFNVDLDGNAVLVFNENINNYSNINGTLQVLTTVKDTVKMSEENTITLTPIAGRDSITLSVGLSTTGRDIAKRGTPNRSYNAETGNWIVDINLGLKSIKDAILKDAMQDGQSFVEGSLKIERLLFNMKGDIVGMDDVTSDFSNLGPDVNIQFGDINNAYRVSFSTNLTDDSLSNYENRAILSGDGFADVSATATIAVGRGVELEKNSPSAGYDAASQTVTWESKINYRQKELTSLNVEDRFNGSQELISLELFEVTLDANGNEQSFTPVTILHEDVQDAGQNGFDLTLPNNKTAYKLVYKTKSIERVLDSEEILNTIKVDGLERSATRRIGQVVLTKGHGRPDYKTETINWTVQINTDRQEMKNVVLTDTFTNGGLELIQDSIRVSGLAPADYNFIPTADGFTIEFNRTLTGPHTLTYTTNFDYMERTNKTDAFLENRARIDWIDTQETARVVTVTDRERFGSYTQNNGFKGGSYDATTKEITWNLGVNFNGRPTTSMMINDTFSAGQVVLKDSLVVSRLTRESGTNEYVVDTTPLPETAYALIWKDDGFVLTFNEATEESYLVSYKTSIDNTFIDPEYNNQAVVTDRGLELGNVSAKVSILHGGSYAEKVGVQKGKVIEWSIQLNYGQSTLDNVVLRDEPTLNQEVLEDSIRIYSTTVAQTGAVTKGSILSKDAYELDFDEATGKFEIAFNDSIDRPYILEYESLILAKVGDDIDNTVSFEADLLLKGTRENKSTIRVARTSGMGTSTGETGMLTILKTDESDSTTLAGAEFELVDKASNRVVKRGETNENGELVFERLLYGEYVLKETKAPRGYLISTESKDIIVDTPEIKSEFTNQKIKQDALLVKRSEKTNDLLEGAIFSLENEDGDVIQSGLTTDENGRLYVNDLEPGEYAFVETGAPSGHLLDSTKRPFTITENQLTETTVNVTNQPFKSIRVSKVDETTGESLTGAVFTLLNKDGQTVREDVETDADGIAIINQLDLGEYTLIETKAPKGYILTNVRHEVEITLISDDIQDVEVKNERQKEVLLTKVDNETNQKLANAEFSLYTQSGTLVKEKLVTDAQGELIIGELDPGTYYFVETRAPSGYLLDSKRNTFQVAPGQSEPTKITVTNEQTKSVRLIKTDASNGSRLANAVFNLLDATGTVIHSNLKTDTNGEILVRHLIPGNYRFVETSAPSGYMLNSTPRSFTLTRGTNEVFEVRMENDTYKSATLRKVDSVTEERLKGATFELLDSNGNVIQSNLTTNDQGEIYVGGLVPGNYSFVEKTAPRGYLLDSKKHTFTLEGRSTGTKLITVTNDTEKTIVLNKVDKKTKAPLQGAEFNLLDAKGDIVQERFVTNASGQIKITGLTPGDYSLIETKAPKGYRLDKTPQTVKVENNQRVDTMVTIENEKLKTLHVEKVDQATRDPLAGAAFTLTNQQGEEVARFVTDKFGKAKITDLIAGVYTLIETKAPKGYELDQTPKKVTFEVLGEDVITLKVTNKKSVMTPTPENPDKDDEKTPENPNTPNDPDTEFGQGEVPVGSGKPDDTDTEFGEEQIPEGAGTPDDPGYEFGEGKTPAGSGKPNQDAKNTGNKLPNTGTDFMYTAILGLLFSLLGLLFFALSRKKKSVN